MHVNLPDGKVYLVQHTRLDWDDYPIDEPETKGAYATKELAVANCPHDEWFLTTETILEPSRGWSIEELEVQG